MLFRSDDNWHHVTATVDDPTVIVIPEVEGLNSREFALFTREGHRVVSEDVVVTAHADGSGEITINNNDGWYRTNAANAEILFSMKAEDGSLADLYGSGVDGGDYYVTYRNYSSFEPNAALNITKVTTLLDNSGLDTSKVESKVVRLDTRNGYHGRNAMQVQEIGRASCRERV